jgi:ribonuclease HI
LKWVAFKSNDHTILGRKTKTISKTEIHIQHYSRVDDGSPIVPCAGCHLNEDQTNKSCRITKFTHSLIEIPVNKSTVSSRYNTRQSVQNRIRISPYSLNKTLDHRNYQQSHQLHSLSINIEEKTLIANQINRYITAHEEKIQELVEIREQLSNFPEINAYTDGSLSNHKTMGFGWIIVGTKELSFKGKIENFPSSSRAEIAAILTLLVTIPANKTVNIFCDSQATISAIQSCLQENTPKKKLHNTFLLRHITQIIRQQRINLMLHKVKAHSGNKHNDTADWLAKRATTLEERHTIKPTDNRGNLDHNTKWNDIQLEVPIQEMAKRICEAKHVLEWRSLNRNMSSINNDTLRSTNWALSVKSLHPSKMTNSNTNEEDHRDRSFRIRLWNNELPTKSKLHDRSFKTYQDNICVRCKKEKETNTHVFNCTENKVNLKRITAQALNEVISAECDHKIGKKLGQEINNHIEEITNEEWGSIIRGCIPKIWKKLINKFSNEGKADSMIIKCKDMITEKMKETWSQRNKIFCEWEVQQDIKAKDKRKWSSDNRKKVSKNKENIIYGINKYINQKCTEIVNMNTLYSLEFFKGMAEL